MKKLIEILEHKNIIIQWHLDKIIHGITDNSNDANKNFLFLQLREMILMVIDLLKMQYQKGQTQLFVRNFQII